MTSIRPLILLTNDDGVRSPGLHAAAAALQPLGDLLIAAPLEQHSGMGRSFPTTSTGRMERVRLDLPGGPVEAFGVDASPAQAVVYALLELAPRRPSLAVVGINYGENVGEGITVSGTVGAALEAASCGLPTLAMSLQTEPEYHYSHSDEVDFGAAARVARILAERMLAPGFALPPDVDLLKVDVPQDATDDTPWRLVRVSRRRYFELLPVEPRDLAEPNPLGYRVNRDWAGLESDSDIHVLVHDRAVSIAPVSIDLSSRAARDLLRSLLDPPGLSFSPLTVERAPEACALVEQVFRGAVAPAFSEQGVAEFLAYVQPSAMAGRLQSGHWGLIAEVGGEAIGVVEVRRQQHVSLWFVRPRWQRKGVGRRLWDLALAHCLERDPPPAEITVNSSLNAAPVYRRLGFRPTGPEQEVNGIHFLPMRYAIGPDGEVERWTR